MQNRKRHSQLVGTIQRRRNHTLKASAWAAWRERVTLSKEQLAEADHRFELQELEVRSSAFSK